MPYYFLGLFSCSDDVFDYFKENTDPSIEILYATYTDEDYSGDATVVYLQGGHLYEVEGSHCSCAGLEGQWSPTQTSLQALRLHPVSPHRPYFSEFLDNLEKRVSSGQIAVKAPKVSNLWSEVTQSEDSEL